MKSPLYPLLAGLFLLCSLSAFAADEHGTVVAVRNHAEACAPSFTCRTLDFGSKVANGDSLKTFIDARMTIRFATGSRVDMGPNSILIMASLQTDGKKTFARWGEFDFEVKKQDSKGRFQVRTPVAVAGAEGTKFHLEVDTSTGDSRLHLIVGKVSITPTDPALPAFLMNPGESLDMKSGAAPVLQNPQGTPIPPTPLTAVMNSKIAPTPSALIPFHPTVLPPHSGTLHIEIGP